MLTDLAHDRIGTLRAIGPTDDQLALRLQLGRTLDRVSLRPTCVPAGAIVCVRHMRIAHAPRPEQWTTAIGEHMESLMRVAVRPFRDAVPADARAVLFVDEAELLACLARDWRSGAAQAWWWRGVFGDTLSEAIVHRAFLSSPTLVPAAMERLARARCLMPVIRVMPQTLCEQLGAAVASVFAIGEWSTSSSSAIPGHIVEGPDPAAAATRAPVRRRIAEALRGDASVDFASLLPEQRGFAGLALLIARAPAIARTPGTTAVLRSHAPWWSSVDVEPTVTAVRRHTPRSDVQFRPQSTLHAITSEQTQDSPHDDGPTLPAATPSLRSARPEIATHDAVESSSTERQVDPRDASPQELPWSSPAPDAVTRTEVDEGLPPVRIVDSEFAGIVYLVNLALHLELYGDFTQPARPGMDLSIADFLALVGERVIGNAFAADSVWSLLADLAGRDSSESPGDELGTNGRGDLPLRIGEWTSQLAECAAPALGMEPSSALPFLCARAGRLALSATRLDVTFDLAAHPLIIRMAGLDRDPGWVPSAGRIIAFHYQ